MEIEICRDREEICAARMSIKERRKSLVEGESLGIEISIHKEEGMWLGEESSRCPKL